MSVERLFTPFFDPVDMTALCPADITATRFSENYPEANCYFPLFIDEDTPLCRQVEQQEYAFRSARYGPFIDNILGMNWQLPNGTLVRVGERVVKSSTGYNLSRFLLHAPRKFGRPHDFVLRLRACNEMRFVAILSGSYRDLNACRQALLQSSWIHVIDSLDWCWKDGEDFIRLESGIQNGNANAYRGYILMLKDRYMLNVDFVDRERPANNLLVAVKLLPGEAASLACELHQKTKLPIACLLVNGYVLVYESAAGVMLQDWELQELRNLACEQGGHVRARNMKGADHSCDDLAESLLEKWTSNLSAHAYT